MWGAIARKGDWTVKSHAYGTLLEMGREGPQKLPCAWHRTCRQPGARREQAAGHEDMFPTQPSRPKALPGQPGVALHPMSGCVRGRGEKLGCEKQWSLGQISGALEQQATGGT